MEIDRVKQEALLTDEEILQAHKAWFSHFSCQRLWEDFPLSTIAQAQLDKLLKHPKIRVEADDQRLPENPFAKAADEGDMYAQSRCSGYYCSQDDMLKPDSEGRRWVRVEKKA